MCGLKSPLKLRVDGGKSLLGEIGIFREWHWRNSCRFEKSVVCSIFIYSLHILLYHCRLINKINRKKYIENEFVITEPRLEKSPFPGGFGPGSHPGAAHGLPPGLSPMAAAQFMALSHPAAAAQAAFLSQSGIPPHFLPTSNPGASLPGLSGGGGGSGASGGGSSSSTGSVTPRNSSLDRNSGSHHPASGLASLEALQRYIIILFPNYKFLNLNLLLFCTEVAF